MASVREQVLALLTDRGAGSIPHSGGFLLAHLKRVEARLHDNGADDALALAGLNHAVYGTDGFNVQLLALDERPQLAEIAGSQVEELVYLYAACDREQTWPKLGTTGLVYDRWTGEAHNPDPEMLTRLVDLTVVNELDVAGNALTFTAGDSASLLDLVHSWTALLSASVVRDARTTLAS